MRLFCAIYAQGRFLNKHLRHFHHVPHALFIPPLVSTSYAPHICHVWTSPEIIEVSQRCALRKHSCKPLCPGIADLIVANIEASQRWTTHQHSCKTPCSIIAYLIIDRDEK
jgi:hypothetical protein